jgi:hypothetical protein
MIILYTTSAAVTAALGLTDRDLTEQQFVDADLEVELRVELNQWVPAHAAIAAYPDLPAPTPAQLNAYDLLTLASKYFCAWRMAQGLALSAPVSITTEGQNSMSRVSFNAKEMQDAMFSGYTKYKGLLEQSLNPAQAGHRLTGASISRPIYDVITAAS